MISNSADYAIAGWSGIAGGVTSKQDWALWARDALQMTSTLPQAVLVNVPSRISRRLNNLGRSVLAMYEQCAPVIKNEPAIITASRHGDLPAMDKLIRCAREGEDISPTAFTYSVHNRFSSLISMFAGYHGVNGAYSSASDGFPLILAEAIALIAENPELQVLVVAYEPEIPEEYHELISRPWLPHVVAFVLQKSSDAEPKFTLAYHTEPEPDKYGTGSCLSLIRTMLNKETHLDGHWEHRYAE